MTIVEFLLARIAEDEAKAHAATPGPWQWWNLEGVDQGWSDQGPNLETIARGPVYEDGSQGPAQTVICGWGHDAWGVTVEPADAAHIAHHDPTRVLAECSAKRRIVEDHAPTDQSHAYGADGLPTVERVRDLPQPACRQCTTSTQAWRITSEWEVADRIIAPCDTIRALAAIYADHPDYRQREWAL